MAATPGFKEEKTYALLLNIQHD